MRPTLSTFCATAPAAGPPWFIVDFYTSGGLWKTRGTAGYACMLSKIGDPECYMTRLDQHEVLAPGHPGEATCCGNKRPDYSELRINHRKQTVEHATPGGTADNKPRRTPAHMTKDGGQ
ncbi:hypothetical protein GCM10017687_82560 [Streptomyces echinatus]